MCMRQQSAPASATTPASAGSKRKADTSFTIVAPASMARRATVAFVVSMESRAPATSAASRSTTGTTRRRSSSSETGSAPGRVDSPPTSRMAAPSAASRRPCSTAASASRKRPPSEKESGVTLTMPMITGARTATQYRSAWLLGGAAGKPRAGQLRRGRGRRLALGRLRRERRRHRHGRRLGAKHLVLALAGQQLDELLALDRLAPQEDLGGRLELLPVLLEHRAGRLMRLLDDPADLVVDLPRDLVGVVGLGRELAPEEGLAVVVAEHARAELLGHAEAHDHLLGGGRDLLEVVRRAGRYLAEDDLLGGAAPERHRHRVGQLRARREELVLGRQGDRVAERLAARDHGDLVDRVRVVEVVGDERVAHLVERRHPALLLGHDAGLLLRARDHAHDPLLQLEVVDLALALPGGEQSGLVHEVLEIGARESGRLPGQHVEVDLLRERLAARVHLEDLLPALAVGAVDHDLAIEAARAEQRRVEDVRAVRGGDEDDVVLHLEAVHLHEQLVQRLLALVVAAAETGAAVAADRVDLVHEDDAGRVL